MKFTLFLFELFWIKIIKNKNKEEFKKKVKNNFFIGENIFLQIFDLTSNHKSTFFLCHFSWQDTLMRLIS